MSRMAGDKLSNLKRKLGDDYGRISAGGLQGGITAPGVGGSGNKEYSAAEVKAEFRESGRKVDEGPNSSVNYFQGLVDGGSKFNGKATRFLQARGVTFPTKVKPEPGDTPGETVPAVGPGGTNVEAETSGDNSPVMTGTTSGNRSPVQQLNTNGGPATAINGNNNTVDNSVDNSRHYGSDIRKFTYKPTGGDDGNPAGLYDSPVSMATMGGFYDVNDGASATAQFLDKYIDNNNLNQQEMRDMYDKRTDFDYKSQADEVNQFNPLAMQERLDREPQIDRDRAYLGLKDMFGDLNGLTWKPSKQPDDIESDVGDIAGDYLGKLT